MTTRDTYDIDHLKKIELYEAQQKELYKNLLEITKWHAQLQIDFEKELFSEVELSKGIS